VLGNIAAQAGLAPGEGMAHAHQRRS